MSNAQIVTGWALLTVLVIVSLSLSWDFEKKAVVVIPKWKFCLLAGSTIGVFYGLIGILAGLYWLLFGERGWSQNHELYVWLFQATMAPFLQLWQGFAGLF